MMSLEMLTEIVDLQTKIVEAGIDKAAVMQSIANGARDLTNSDGAVIEMRQGDEMFYAAVSPGLAENYLGFRLAVGTSMSGLCMNSGELLECFDSENDPRANREACRKIGLRSMVVVPLKAGPETLGVLKVMSAVPGSMSDEKKSALLLLARLLGASIRNANELKDEKHKLEAVFNDSPAAMAIMRGRDLQFEKVNPLFQQIYGDRDLVGRTLLEAAPEMRGQSFPDLLYRVLETGEMYSGREVPAKIRDTEKGDLVERYFDFSYVRLNNADGRPYGVYNHSIDVTDRVLAKRQLQVAKDEAERANQAKTFFLANVSHEIRTPLTSILGYSEILQDETLESSDRQKFSAIVERHGKALIRIIDDVLDLTKIESGKISIEKTAFNVQSLFSDIIDIFRDRAEEKKLSVQLIVEPGVPKQIKSDPVRLRQILINLVGNAVKFTAAGSVTVRVWAERVEAGLLRMRIQVKDTGIGIAPADRAKLFKPFSQANEAMDRDFGGSGLGLVLASRLAEALGGQVTLASEPQEKGTTMEVMILVSEASLAS